MVGATAGSYQIISKIGEGGMGVVYLGRHAILGRPAAIKILLPELSSRRDVVARFFNEARAATAVRHPGIVEIYDFGCLADGSVYLAMELLEGESLASRLQREQRLSVPAAIQIGRQIAAALQAAHGKGITHRDLKPDNVFLVPDPEIGERVKLLDFGIAKLAAEDTKRIHTRTGMVIGTPAYMSPEQCRGASTLDSRSDLYSLGCMLYELLAGHPVFDAEGAGDVIAHHLYFEPEPVRKHEPSVPEPLEQLIRSLLSKDPAMRPGTAGDIVAVLDEWWTWNIVPSAETAQAATIVAVPFARPGRIAAQAPTTLGGSASATGAAGAARRPRRSRRIVWLAAAAAAAVVAAVGIAVERTRSQPIPRAAASAPTTAAPPPAPVPPAPAPEPAPPAPAPPAPAPEPAPPAPAPQPAPPAPAAQAAPHGDANDPAAATPAEPGPAVAVEPPRAAPDAPAAPAAPDAPAPPRRRGAKHSKPPPVARRIAAVDPVSAPPVTPAEPAEIPPPVTAPPAPPPPAPVEAPPVEPAPEPAPKPGSAPAQPTPPPAPPPTAPSHPGSLDAVSSIARVRVDGPLPDSEIRSMIERALGTLRACYRGAAKRASRTPPLRVTLSFEVDEGRAVRNLRIGGDTLGLGACVKDAAAMLRTRVAPDVGTAAVDVVIEFQPTGGA